MIDLRVTGIPQPQGNKTAFTNKNTGKTVLVEGRNAEARRRFHDWREAVRIEASDWIADNDHPPPIGGAVSIIIDFYLPRPKSAPKRVTRPTKKPDLDKLVRSVLDAIVFAGLIVDDSLVTFIGASKFFADDRGPGARIIVRDIEASE